MHHFRSNNSSNSTQNEDDDILDRELNDTIDPEEKEARKVFNIAKEIMSSEEDYVRSLKLLSVDFKEFIASKWDETSPSLDPKREFDPLFQILMQLQILNADFLLDFKVSLVRKEALDDDLIELIEKKNRPGLTTGPMSPRLPTSLSRRDTFSSSTPPMSSPSPPSLTTSWSVATSGTSLPTWSTSLRPDLNAVASRFPTLCSNQSKGYPSTSFCWRST